MTLKRLVLDFRTGELVMRVLYRSDGRSNPGTKARAGEVTELARSGLQDALEALEEDVEIVGTSGYTTREDVLCTREAPAVIGEHKKRATSNG